MVARSFRSLLPQSPPGRLSKSTALLYRTRLMNKRRGPYDTAALQQFRRKKFCEFSRVFIGCLFSS
jgi:hypothetical protein